MIRQRVVLSRSLSLEMVSGLGMIRYKIRPITLDGFKSYSKKTLDDHVVSGWHLERNGSKTVVIIPGLFADSNSLYARWISRMIQKNTTYNVLLLDGFASMISFQRKSFPLGLGTTEALCFAEVLKDIPTPMTLIAFSYSGSTTLFLHQLLEFHRTILVNPLVDSERAFVSLDGLRGKPGHLFREARANMAKALGIDHTLNFRTIFREYFQPKRIEFLSRHKPTWIDLPPNPRENLIGILDKDVSLISSDTDPVILKMENAEILFQAHRGSGTYYDANEGYHTQYFLTHPSWFEKTLLDEITR